MVASHTGVDERVVGDCAGFNSIYLHLLIELKGFFKLAIFRAAV